MKYLMMLLLFFVFCTTDNNIGGSISDVDLEIALLYGYVVDVNGLSKKGAEIILYKPDSTLSDEGEFGAALDTLFTDENGKYEFDSLDFGTYSIFANFEDSLFAQNLFINHDTITFAGVDTLKKPGTIKGKVILDNVNNMGVLVYIPGTSHISVSDSAGDFTISDIPSDSSYTLVFQYYGYAIVQLSEVTVISGDTVSLAPVILTKNEYPIGVSAHIDSISNVVTVTWNKMPGVDIKGYLVYRKDSSETASFPKQLNVEKLLTDTIFIDTLREELFSQQDTITFQYHVKSKNLKEDLSPFSNPVYVNAFTLRDSLTKKSLSIISPKDDDSIIGMENFRLEWDYTGLVDSVQLHFTPNNGASWFSINNKIKNRGFYIWSVPNISSENCRIKILDSSDSLLYDESDIFNIKAIDNSNIIKNGDFSQGVAYWLLNKFEEAQANISTSDGSCDIIIDSIGFEAWHINLAQRSIPLMQGYIYKIKFDAKASAEKKIKVGLAMGHAPWTNYSEASFTVSNEMKTYSNEFMMSDNDDFNADILFAIGADTSNITLDNISLEIVN